MNRDDITASHRARAAYVYVRQSSLHQVAHHQESLRRQRQLEHRAVELGWPPDHVVVVDEDLGHTAARGGRRSGFAQMVAEAALGHVGIIFALEVSRISRGSRDWYHLLDICAISRTLIADAEGLYDPRAYNDRLLLGLKGTMSEAELHLMKQRLVEAMRSKAARGEFRFRLPAGYVWDEAGRMVKDPDEQVRTVIELVFARFAELGTIHAVQAALGEQAVRVPVLRGRKHALRWAAPAYPWLHRLLTSPLYAGGLRLRQAAGRRGPGCCAAAGQADPQASTRAVAGVDPGPSRGLHPVGDLRAQPAADRLQSARRIRAGRAA